MLTGCSLLWGSPCHVSTLVLLICYYKCLSSCTFVCVSLTFLLDFLGSLSSTTPLFLWATWVLTSIVILISIICSCLHTLIFMLACSAQQRLLLEQEQLRTEFKRLKCEEQEKSKRLQDLTYVWYQHILLFPIAQQSVCRPDPFVTDSSMSLHLFMKYYK